ncbi:MAG: aldehyde dehydrogenase family protein [Chloroflexi bacterium]|nr:aldehyde dehydrogenase family protein [Chloroflexota bacterium]OJW06517.1 MAG: aldehyde dehydrogenase family protein [Chloroflexi bacterium 54-19]
MQNFKNYIGGQWVESSSGKTFENANPANYEEVIGNFPLATADDTRRAIEAARNALEGWANMPGPGRGMILDKASQLLDARKEEIAAALTTEEGKTLAEARGEVMRARDIFRYFSGEGWRMGGHTVPGNTGKELLYTRREALGVVALITPWNFPIAIPSWKIAPALAYGNTVVFKPASFTPHTALLLTEVLVDAGLPPGVFNFITGSGREVGDVLASSPLINGLSFTGSTTVGTGIYAQAIKNLTRVQLEMGGKNPLVVLNDADLALATSLTVAGGFGLTGQACTATSRVIVEEGIADAYAQAVTEAAKKLVVGDGLKSGVQMGPAVSRDQLETDLKYIKIGQEQGASMLAGGVQPAGGGYYVAPTVFDRVETGMTIAQEEIFGPVVSIIRAKDFDDALAKANNIGFGLSAGIVTNDLKKSFNFANRIDAGVVKVNEPTTGLALQAPFGGFKNSSANTFKEQGQSAIEFYTRLKTIYISHG